MKPKPFAYAKAHSVDHAVGLLGQDESRVIAGGQSLVVTLSMRLSSPSLLVDINGLNELDSIALKGDHVAIGALTRQVRAERSEAIAQHAPLIALAMPHIAHPAIRNRGTIGGSVAFADPAAELPACILALGGEIEIASVAGPRTVQVDDFFRGLFETALEPNELLTEIRIPKTTPEMRFGFAELARRHGDYALAGLAATARADSGNLKDVRLAFFAVGETPIRAKRAERALSDGTIADAVAALADDLSPFDDIQASAAEKKHLASVLLKRVAGQWQEARP